MNSLFLAVRSLRKSPGLSVSIILLLGFGIGANTALFSVLRSTLLQPEPGVARPGELVRIRRTQNGKAQSNQSYPDYLDCRDQAKSLNGLVAERIIQARLAGPPAEIVTGAIVSGNYFTVLGARAAAGRLLGPDNDRVSNGHPRGGAEWSFWRRRFGGEGGVLGRTVVLNANLVLETSRFRATLSNEVKHARNRAR